jgi:hypothetical protein
MKTVIVGLLLASLLFTPLGRGVGEIAMSELAKISRPAPDPAQVAWKEAANQAWCAANPSERAYHWPPCGR